MTDNELIKKVLVKIGFEVVQDVNSHHYGNVFYDPKTYLTWIVGYRVEYGPDEIDPINDANHWMMVVNYLVKEKEYFFRLYIAPNGVKVARFWYLTNDHTDKTFSAQDDSEGRAVCLAALKALGGEDD